MWTRSDGESGTVMITLIIEAVDTSDRQERKRLRNRETEGEKRPSYFGKVAQDQLGTRGTRNIIGYALPGPACGF